MTKIWMFRKDGSSVLIDENGFAIFYGNSHEEEGTKTYRTQSSAILALKDMMYYRSSRITQPEWETHYGGKGTVFSGRY